MPDMGCQDPQICQYGVPQEGDMGPLRVVEQTLGRHIRQETPQTPPTSGRRPWDPWEVPNRVKYGGKTPKTRILRCLAVGHLNGNQWGSCSYRYPPTGDYTPFGCILTPYGARPWKVRYGPPGGGWTLYYFPGREMTPMRSIMYVSGPPRRSLGPHSKGVRRRAHPLQGHSMGIGPLQRVPRTLLGPLNTPKRGV